MKRVYVVSSYGRPIAAFDELDDALMLSDAIYGEGGGEHVHETLFMREQGECVIPLLSINAANRNKHEDGDEDAQ